MNNAVLISCRSFTELNVGSCTTYWERGLGRDGGDLLLQTSANLNAP